MTSVQVLWGMNRDKKMYVRMRRRLFMDGDNIDMKLLKHSGAMPCNNLKRMSFFYILCGITQVADTIHEAEVCYIVIIINPN